MKWQEYAKRLKEVLGLEYFPIAVTYTYEPPEGYDTGKARVCNVLKDSAKGKTVVLSKENSACSGGSYYLGLTPLPEGNADKALKKFLVEGEKLCISIAVFNRFRALVTPPPLGLAPYVVFSPMEKAVLRPDIVVFLCNAEQACRIQTLVLHQEGIPPKIQMLGATCHQAVAYPLVSGEVNVSLMDYTSRKIFDKNDMFITVPYHKIPNMVDSIDKCTAGTAPLEYPPEFLALNE
ncbi:MAG: DUF169 domain-containing protein [Chloroflexi bacterium]|nr:DUF169 domain-containing protein [Chloroflexota bacterium]